MAIVDICYIFIHCCRQCDGHTWVTALNTNTSKVLEIENTVVLWSHDVAKHEINHSLSLLLCSNAVRYLKQDLIAEEEL